MDELHQPLQRAIVLSATGTAYEKGPGDVRLPMAILRAKWALFQAHTARLSSGETDKRRRLDEQRVANIDARIASVIEHRRRMMPVPIERTESSRHSKDLRYVFSIE